MVLGNFVGIQIEVNDLGPFGVDGAQLRKNLGHHVGTHNQVYIAFLGDGPAVGAEHVPRSALVKRVRGVEDNIAKFNAIHFRAQDFGHALRFFSGPGISHAVANEQHGLFGGKEHVGGLLYERGRGQHARRGQRRGMHRLVVEGVEHVHRQAHVHRAHRGRGRDFDGPPQGAQQRLRREGHGGVFGHRRHHGHQVVGHLRVHVAVADAGVGADNHQRGMPALGLVQGAHRVADAGRAVQLHQRGLLGGAGVAVGHQHGHAFLERQDVLHRRVFGHGVQETLLYRARISEHVVHPVEQKLLDNLLVARLTSHSASRLCRVPPPVAPQIQTSIAATGP